MFQNIFYILFAGILFCMPVLFWMYVCTGNMQNSYISRRQFFLGIFAGALSAWIFSYLPNSEFSFIFENIFASLSENSGPSFPLSAFVSFLFLFLLINIFISTLFFIFQRKFSKYIQISFVFYIQLIFFAMIGVMFFLLGMRDEISRGVSFGVYSFLTLGALVSYYSIIALSEEGVKYFSSLGAVTQKIVQHKHHFLLTGLTVALGFSFFETFLYAYSYFKDQSFDSELIKLIFFRNIFSLSLHVLCSLLMSFAFWCIFSTIKRKLSHKVILFFLFAFLSLGVHIVFDISLHFGFIGIIFLCVSVLYIFFSYIMGNQETL